MEFRSVGAHLPEMLFHISGVGALRAEEFAPRRDNADWSGRLEGVAKGVPGFFHRSSVLRVNQDVLREAKPDRAKCLRILLLPIGSSSFVGWWGRVVTGDVFPEIEFSEDVGHLDTPGDIVVALEGLDAERG